MLTTKIQNFDKRVKLERFLIDAYYLGLSLKELARDANFPPASACDLGGDFLLAWARMVEQSLRGTPEDPSGACAAALSTPITKAPQSE
jgi:hypothetical protein